MFQSNFFRKITSGSLFALGAFGYLSGINNRAFASTTTPIDVSVELMLSIDVSGSVNTSEYNVQMDGYAAAFRDDEVISTIESLPDGLAVGVQFWATRPAPAQPWRVLKTEQDSRDFADYLDSLARPNSSTTSLYTWNNETRSIGSGTNITGAITAATSEVVNNDYNSAIRVIDISGDGKSNWSQYNGNGTKDGNCNSGDNPCQGVKNARDAAVAQGITINGLPIEPNSTSTTMTNYYIDNVKGGTKGFVETSTTFDDFTRAATQKISTEIENAAGELGIPDANPDTIVTNEHTAVSYNLIAGDPNNNNDGQDTDPDGDTLTVSKFIVASTEYNPGQSVLMPSGITLSVASNGDVTYDPVATGLFDDFNEGDTLPSPDTFTYVVEDGDGNTNSAGVTLDIHGVADSPVAANNNYTTDENSQKWMTVLANDDDSDTDKEDLKITKINGIEVSNVGDEITLASGAKVRLKLVNPVNHSTKGKYALQYDPTTSWTMQSLNDGETRDETLTYTVEDDKNKTDVGSITITVTGITDTFGD